ncbi:leucine-rich repeat and IQ domain-containing protein 3 isoform X2 [Monodelphis domestica]|uniref:leucine-rich repeat and IQ domain-containing protein 3 isoform X2 n=1 Tax=Monodelphis domestica TaxID=13616 RepID=UPI0024E229F2|nr:leucine-rich repeat and IQ domain-containing protein 3 isoform X2 [Monodelphis domestica]
MSRAKQSERWDFFPELQKSSEPKLSDDIKFLPDATFWGEMTELKLLYLHDNSFVKLKNMCSLSGCPKLLALTMYDCPVSLKKGYRHVIVNSIWSLKLLDHYVISDEEVIENWTLPERFKSFTKQLSCDITPLLLKGTNYEKEVYEVNRIISKINKIVAHNSPVVIIQRWLRGHLTRQIWKESYARWLRGRKPFKFFKRKPLKIPTTPKKLSKGEKEKEQVPKEEHLPVKELVKEKPAVPEKQVHAFYKRMGSPIKHRILSAKHRSLLFHALSELRKKEYPQQLPRFKPIKVSKIPAEEKIDYQEMDFSFSMPVMKARMHLTSPSLLLPKLKEIKPETYHRPTFRLCHLVEKPEVQIIPYLERVEKKKPARPLCTVDFGPLLSVDRQYLKKEQKRNQQEKIALIAMIHLTDEITNQSVRDYIQERILSVKKRNEEESKKINEHLENFQANKTRVMKEFHERKTKFLEERQQRTEDRMLVEEICNQHCTLTKELFQFDRFKKRQDVMNDKKEFVNKMRETEKYRKTLVKRMKKGRIKVIHKRHIEEKIITHAVVSQKASDRLQEAKDRVAAMKKHHVYVPLGLGKPSFFS